MSNIKQFFGRNIKRFRDGLNISSEELAKKADLEAGVLAAIEDGVDEPTIDILLRMSQALSIPVATLCEQEPDYTKYLQQLKSARPDIYLLSDLELPTREKNSAEVLIDITVKLTNLCEIENRVKLPCQICYENSEMGVERLAATTRQLLKIGDASVINYASLLEDYGFHVLFFPMSDEIESFSYGSYQQQLDFIFINSNLPFERRTFRLAYELGVLYTYQNSAKPLVRYGSKEVALDQSQVAARFAAAFLIPEKSIEQQMSALRLSPKDWSYELLIYMKRRFGISAESFLYRLRGLKLISESAYREIKNTILRHYKNSNNREPYPVSPNGMMNNRLFEFIELARIRDSNNIILTKIRRIIAELQLSDN